MLQEPGRYHDGGGLYLLIDKAGAKRWVFRFRQDGRLREAGLGSLTAVSLAKAREAAARYREATAAGKDPIAANSARAPRSVTFREALDSMIESRASLWKSDKHRKQWSSAIEQHAARLLPMPVDAITTDDVMRVLRPIWSKIPETATRMRGRIEAVLDASIAMGDAPGPNPARWRGHLAMLLPKPRKLTRGHHRALPADEMPALMARLADDTAMSAAALRFLILTAARSGEVRGMTWGEVAICKNCKLHTVKGDSDHNSDGACPLSCECVWTVPASRMKSGREHRVPLSRQAVAILFQRQNEAILHTNGIYGQCGLHRTRKENLQVGNDSQMPDIGKKSRKEPQICAAFDTDSLIFPGERSGRPMSDMTMSKRLRDMGVDATPHGFRSTFRDWAGDRTDHAREVIEAALAHAVGDQTERAYRRGDALDKRRVLMQDWADFCMGVV